MRLLTLASLRYSSSDVHVAPPAQAPEAQTAGDRPVTTKPAVLPRAGQASTNFLAAMIVTLSALVAAFSSKSRE